MHEREREEGWGLTEDGSGGGDRGSGGDGGRGVSGDGEEAGASPVTARKAVVARKDRVASTAAPVALTRPRGSVALGAALVASTAHGSGGIIVGGEVGRL